LGVLSGNARFAGVPLLTIAAGVGLWASTVSLSLEGGVRGGVSLTGSSLGSKSTVSSGGAGCVCTVMLININNTTQWNNTVTIIPAVCRLLLKL
jgi:hypothetical protein